MAKTQGNGNVTEFYETHPISETQIVQKLEADGVDLETLREETLQNYDQDHFGGIAANDALAARAGIKAGYCVLDVCCGLGGPARYLADTLGCRVKGIDLTASRIEGARSLTAMTGLDHLVSFECANALDLPLDDASFDAVISQEAFCHIPGKDRLIAECVRVLKPGGRIAFTDILATDKTTDATRKRLNREMTFYDLSSLDGYRETLSGEGCRIVGIDDLGADWRDILKKRLAMYRSLKDQTVQRFGQAHYQKWDDAYAFFVGQYDTGELGGARIVAERV